MFSIGFIIMMMLDLFLWYNVIKNGG
jgi:hypothetical protein